MQDRKNIIWDARAFDNGVSSSRPAVDDLSYNEQRCAEKSTKLDRSLGIEMSSPVVFRLDKNLLQIVT